MTNLSDLAKLSDSELQARFESQSVCNATYLSDWISGGCDAKRIDGLRAASMIWEQLAAELNRRDTSTQEEG